MSWRKTMTSGRNTRRADRAGNDVPELLEVWGPASEAGETWIALPGTAAAATADAAGGAFTCIRLNCVSQGIPTADVRCPVCGHGTGMLRDYRWPRPNLA
ncbi:hypothetical protein [uncultured Jatrophihabitans sp.]|uniref:hypothetical protein n=1 Tax=uncultured Jatrophihabitans sp. TaxID=1610747 RepID=UPI0035C94E97